MFLSKFTICFLAAFALFCFVSAKNISKNESVLAIHDANIEKLDKLCKYHDYWEEYKPVLQFVLKTLVINGYKVREAIGCFNVIRKVFIDYISYQTYNAKFLTYQDRVYTCDFEVHYVYQSKSFKIVHHDCILNGGPLVNEKETTKK